jgi:hypothetical protein
MKFRHVFPGAIVVSVIFLLFMACNGSDRQESVVALKDTIKIDRNVDQAAALTGVNETLPVLFLDSTEVRALRKKIIFRFYIDSAHDMVIRGWSGNPGADSPKAAVYPRASILSTVKLQDSVFLGNILLRKDSLQNIRKLMGSGPGKYAFLKFVPAIDSKPGSKGQIVYRLVFTNTKPMLRQNLSTDSLRKLIDSSIYILQPGDFNSNFSLNPSPPRMDEEQ